MIKKFACLQGQKQGKCGLYGSEKVVETPYFQGKGWIRIVKFIFYTNLFGGIICQNLYIE